MNHNIRHLRIFLAVAKLASISKAARECGLSQPAVTQAINKMEAEFDAALFDRTPQGVFATRLGALHAGRIGRAMSIIDAAFLSVAPRLRLTATASQLEALIAVRETGNFTLAARRIGIAQPTVHRAVSQLEKEALRPLFERTSAGIVATRGGQMLASAARLMEAELVQADMEIAEALGRETGRIVVGAMPLSRAYLMPKVIAQFRRDWSRLPLRVLDGPYDEMISGLRNGEIDFLIGALRNPAPIGDIEQTPLFDDTLAIVAGPDHPLAGKSGLGVEDLINYPWAVAAAGTPTRDHFERMFSSAGLKTPESIVETASLILIRELLASSDHLGCVSALQAEAEIKAGRIARINFELSDTARPIGITTRRGWKPTPSQAKLIELVSNYQG
ncbi:MAG: LysR family transcriptional regulator [Hoeflea sp. BRH_c9]|nr:MAG: LysR family transcriptional regulator [Hoeflea sp. BRH_c9]